MATAFPPASLHRERGESEIESWEMHLRNTLEEYTLGIHLRNTLEEYTWGIQWDRGKQSMQRLGKYTSAINWEEGKRGVKSEAMEEKI